MEISEGLILCRWLLAGLTFAGLVKLGIWVSPKRVILHAYEAVCMRARTEKKGWWDYEKWNDFLTENGATFHYGSWINPVSYMALCMAACFCGLVVGNWYNMWVGFMSGAAGALLPGILLEYLNRRDNERMLIELDLVYSALAIQVRAGVFVSDALTECYTSVSHPRLRKALQELCSDIVMKSDLGKSLEEFQGKFSNKYIDTLCITIMQACESGQAVELLSDIAEQIRDMEILMQHRRKEKLDRSTTFYQLGIFALTLCLTLYLCITNLLSASLFFGN